MQPRIVVVGSLNMDMSLGVTRLPRPGETTTALSARFSPGGKGANQALAAAQLGARVSMVGRVGVDTQGDELVSNLRKANVCVDWIARETESTTGMAVIVVDEAGQNSIVVWPAANDALSADRVKEAEGVIAGSQALIVQFETPMAGVEEALGIARRRKVLTVCNPAPARRVESGLLANVDILIPNEVEASMISDVPVRDIPSAMRAAESIRSRGAARVVVTLGENGAIYAGPEGRLHCPAFSVRSVDTTGAGDAFVAGFAVAWLTKPDPWHSLQYACAVGAIVTQTMGAQSPALSEENVQELLRTASGVRDAHGARGQGGDNGIASQHTRDL